MKVLLVSARFPAPEMKGDQLRSRQLVELLAADHEVTVLTAGAPPSPQAFDELSALATVRTIPTGTARRLAGAAAAAVRGLPIQVGWMTPGPVRREIERAARDHGVVIVCTIRCLPRRLPAATVLDHIDSLSLNMRQRARWETHPALRAAARIEARRLARHERRAARWVAAQTVVSSIDAAELPAVPPPVVLPLLLPEITPAVGAVRDIDIILTGDMGYPPNREAAAWLAQEIVPRITATHPRLRVVVAGRAASARLRLDDVEVHSDVPDLRALLQRARVAAVPLRSGTGSPTKVFEAAACGAAVVATPWVAEAIDADLDTAGDASTFAASIERLLDDDELRCRRADATLRDLRRRDRTHLRVVLEELLLSSCAVGAVR